MFAHIHFAGVGITFGRPQEINKHTSKFMLRIPLTSSSAVSWCIVMQLVSPQNQKEINEHGRELMRFEGDTTVEVTSVRPCCREAAILSLSLSLVGQSGKSTR
jgi:hypothetical protein